MISRKKDFSTSQSLKFLLKTDSKKKKGTEFHEFNEAIEKHLAKQASHIF